MLRVAILSPFNLYNSVWTTILHTQSTTQHSIHSIICHLAPPVLAQHRHTTSHLIHHRANKILPAWWENAFTYYQVKKHASTLASVAQFGWVSSHALRGHRSNFWSGHMPVLPAGSPVAGRWGGKRFRRQSINGSHWCFSSLLSEINKNIRKKHTISMVFQSSSYLMVLFQPIWKHFFLQYML